MPWWAYLLWLAAFCVPLWLLWRRTPIERHGGSKAVR
jgi:hypothetical protein